MPRLSGLVPILATPFADDGALDPPSLRRLVEFQLWCGADGLAVFGMASEGFALTAAERRLILREVTSVVAGAVPLVAGVNATSLGTAREQADEAVAGGAASLMVLPPYLVKPSPGQLVDFYGGLGETTDAELMVQDAPGVTGVAMPAPLIHELAKLDGVTSVKVEAQPTAPKIASVLDGVPEGFSVLGGQNAFFLLEELARGAVGTMPAGEFADRLRPVLDAHAAGDRAAARAGFDRLLPLIRFGMQPGIAWAVHKEVLVRRGVIASAAVRLPAAPLDRGGRQDLDELLDVLALERFRP
jgi:dihydrodipicolinate synthase/N-acetylneuraminate lyase